MIYRKAVPYDLFRVVVPLIEFPSAKLALGSLLRRLERNMIDLATGTANPPSGKTADHCFVVNVKENNSVKLHVLLSQIHVERFRLR